jgi:hypothetical protein
MEGGWSRWPLWAGALLGIMCLLPLHSLATVSVDLSNTVQRHHVIYFGDYSTSKGPMSNKATGVSANTRYVQLSNGSRFVCDSTELEHHDPPRVSLFPLNMAMRSVINSIKDAGLPCTHVVDEDHSTVLCWDREVRLDTVTAQATRMLGRSSETEPQEYWMGRDCFGPYAATVYGNGEECVYTKQPTETEIRFYCRYTEMENPIPFLTLQEASQCHFVLRVLSSKFCFVSHLDHAMETETVRCRMLE